MVPGAHRCMCGSLEVGGVAAAGLLAWDSATPAGSDAFWALVNPDGGELTVEILPPVRVALRPRRPSVPPTPLAQVVVPETATPVPDNATSTMVELPDANEDAAPELAWERMVDRWRLEWLEWARGPSHALGFQLGRARGQALMQGRLRRLGCGRYGRARGPRPTGWCGRAA